VTGWRPLREPGGPEPRRLSESLGRYRTGLSLVLGAWADVVGESVAAHAKPVAVRNGALVVEVDDPAWATQLRWLGDDLLARLAERIGSPVADRVEIRVQRR
jgi:predicted nucleic acid-binding Zn ribbon protein